MQEETTAGDLNPVEWAAKVLGWTPERIRRMLRSGKHQDGDERKPWERPRVEQRPRPPEPAPAAPDRNGLGRNVLLSNAAARSSGLKSSGCGTRVMILGDKEAPQLKKRSSRCLVHNQATSRGMDRCS